MRKNQAIYMGTTKIDAGKTAAEISELLGRYGVTTVQSTFDRGEVVGLAFSIVAGSLELYYKLPVRHEPVLQVLKKSKMRGEYKNEAQARRTAWRQVLRWVEAQMALIETGMADIKEIFLPYMMTPQGRTLFQEMSGARFLLGGPES